MSFHFLNGTTYGPYSDTGPGTIVVDPLATVQATGSDKALELASGPWQVTVNGAVNAVNHAIGLTGTGALLSNLTVGAGGSIESTSNIAVKALHAANVTNRGEIRGSNRGIEQMGDGNYTINNLKGAVIEGGNSYGIAALGSGIHTILNAGLIASTNNRAISGSDGIEKVTNFGRIDGQAHLGDGNDVFTNFKKVGKVIKHGSVNGGIDLGAGDDKFYGGNKAETVVDDAGKDSYKLAGGNDHFYAYLAGNGDLVDVVDGGKNIDLYDASYSGANGVRINLDNVAHSYGPDTLAANFAVAAIGGTPGDKMFNFEDVGGTGGNDVIFGSMGANELNGNRSNDNLFGLGGNDRLVGGDGEDVLAGGAGKDELWGGADADRFVFTSQKDSGPAAKTRDIIHDFEGAGVAGGDLINLDGLNAKLGGIIDTFLGVDVAFTGQKGDLRAVTSGDNTIVQLDINGDKKADFSIALDGLHALTVDDFDL